MAQLQMLRNDSQFSFLACHAGNGSHMASTSRYARAAIHDKSDVYACQWHCQLRHWTHDMRAASVHATCIAREAKRRAREEAVGKADVRCAAHPAVLFVVRFLQEVPPGQYGADDGRVIQCAAAAVALVKTLDKSGKGQSCLSGCTYRLHMQQQEQTARHDQLQGCWIRGTA